MKNIWIFLSLFLSFYGYSQVYQVKINDQSKSLSQSIVIKTVARAFSLSCSEGVLNSAERTCTVTNQITRIEECPSGYINQGNGTCEANQTVSASRYCSSGTDVGSGCQVTYTRSPNMTCPSGYRSVSGVCRLDYGYPNNCPSGYTYNSYVEVCYDDSVTEPPYSWVSPTCSSGTLISGRCYGGSTSAVPSCDSGYTYNGSTCTRTVIRSYSYSCPSGFSLSGSFVQE